MNLTIHKAYRVIVAVTGGLMLTCLAGAEEQKLSEYIRPSLLETNTSHAEISFKKTFAVEPLSTAVARPRQDNRIRRWTQFQAEYGMRTNYSSFATHAIGTAKYAVDYTSLAMQEFADTLRDTFQFEYQLRNLGRATPQTSPPHRIRDNMLFDAWENARFQTSLDLQVASKSFVGLKLIIPFGE